MIRILKMDLDHSSFNDLLNSSAFEEDVTPNTSINDNGESLLAHEIPNCPAGSRLQILHSYPDSVIEPLLYTPADKMLLSKIFPVIFAIGLVTNFAFLFTIYRVREMRTTTNFYLANLAIADLTLIISKGVVLVYKFIWSSDLDRGVPFKSAPACAATNGSVYVGYYASICLVTMVSIERFLAICHPLKHRMTNSKWHAIKMVTGAWLIGISLAALISPTFGKLTIYCIVWPEKYQHLPKVLGICSHVKDVFINLSSLVEFIPFTVAISVNSILYFMIILRLSQRNITKGEKESYQAVKVRNSVARMLILNGIIFFLCLAPFQFHQMYYFVVRLTGKNNLDHQNLQILAWVGRCLDLVNSAVNPIIYSATNARYRKAFLTAFGCTSSLNERGSTETQSSMATKSISYIGKEP